MPIEAEKAQTQALERTLKILSEGLLLRQAVALALRLTVAKKSLVYEMTLGVEGGELAYLCIGNRPKVDLDLLRKQASRV